MPLKTYSRIRAHTSNTNEPASKRRRVSTPEEDRAEINDTLRKKLNASPTSPLPTTTSSSPLHDASIPAIFSDPVVATRDPTPPSSPPPPVVVRRPTFSFVKRQQTTIVEQNPLSEVSGNKNASTPASGAGKVVKKQRLTQMTLDLGIGPANVRCKVCGMEYIPSNGEDAALHRKHHVRHLDALSGVEVPKSFNEGTGASKIWLGPAGACVVVVTREDDNAIRKTAVRILRAAERELGAVAIPDEALWDAVETIRSKYKHKENKGQERNLQVDHIKLRATDKYKIYLYLSGQRCVGICLAEHVTKAYRVVPQTEPLVSHRASSEESNRYREECEPRQENCNSATVCANTTSHPVFLGISRIWTPPKHRGKGIARRLLDCARANYYYGVEVPKGMVAFSQPTESGARLARGWFGMQSGWSVYVDV